VYKQIAVRCQEKKDAPGPMGCSQDADGFEREFRVLIVHDVLPSPRFHGAPRGQSLSSENRASGLGDFMSLGFFHLRLGHAFPPDRSTNEGIFIPHKRQDVENPPGEALDGTASA